MNLAQIAEISEVLNLAEIAEISSGNSGNIENNHFLDMYEIFGIKTHVTPGTIHG